MYINTGFLHPSRRAFPLWRYIRFRFGISLRPIKPWFSPTVIGVFPMFSPFELGLEGITYLYVNEGVLPCLSIFFICWRSGFGFNNIWKHKHNGLGIGGEEGGAGHCYANIYVYENPMFQDQIQVLECFKWVQKIQNIWLNWRNLKWSQC